MPLLVCAAICQQMRMSFSVLIEWKGSNLRTNNQYSPARNNRNAGEEIEKEEEKENKEKAGCVCPDDTRPPESPPPPPSR
jgi:hypothetical protein